LLEIAASAEGALLRESQPKASIDGVGATLLEIAYLAEAVIHREPQLEAPIVGANLVEIAALAEGVVGETLVGARRLPAHVSSCQAEHPQDDCVRCVGKTGREVDNAIFVNEHPSSIIDGRRPRGNTGPVRGKLSTVLTAAVDEALTIGDVIFLHSLFSESNSDFVALLGKGKAEIHSTRVDLGEFNETFELALVVTLVKVAEVFVEVEFESILDDERMSKLCKSLHDIFRHGLVGYNEGVDRHDTGEGAITVEPMHSTGNFVHSLVDDCPNWRKAEPQAISAV